MPSTTLRPSPRDRRRGTILLVTALFATGIALSLGSFIMLSLRSLELANRSYFSNSSLDLAEAGVEEALYALNNANWTGWGTHSSGSDNKVYTIGNIALGQGTVGTVTVVVYGATTALSPKIVAEGKATPAYGTAISKQIEVKVRRRSHWATGLVAKDDITFSGGNASVDSYISDDDVYSTDGLYDPAKKRDKGTAGSIKVTTDAISISNSDIWGYVATGGSSPQVGPNGTIRGEDTPNGVKVDPDRISTDFTANFDGVTVPTGGSPMGNISGDYSFGVSGTSTTYQVANLSNTNGKTIEIVGDVTMIVTSTVDIKGELVVRDDSSLTIYVAGDMTIGGNGVINETGLPENMVIYGTTGTTGGQTIKLNGNAAVHAAVYAPNAHIEMKGGGSSGEMSGSVVGYDIVITGNYAFHYDEALAKKNSGNPFAIARWRELVTAADRYSL